MSDVAFERSPGCQKLAETVWTDIVKHTVAGRFDKAEAVVTKFLAFMELDVKGRSAEDAARYRAAVDFEWRLLQAEFERDKEGLARRLGVAAAGSDALTKVAMNVGQQYTGSSGGQTLGETAVKTAVRATIWTTIRALFR